MNYPLFLGLQSYAFFFETRRNMLFFTLFTKFSFHRGAKRASLFGCRRPFKGIKQPVKGLVGISSCIVEQCDELRPDDGTLGIVESSLEGLCVADAEAYHTWVFELHLVDSPEVFLLLLVETLLGTGCGRRTDHIDEAVGILVDETYALLTGFWCDEHDEAQVVPVGYRLHDSLVVVEWQVGDNGSADATFHTTLAEFLYAVMKYGVEISHHHERYVHLVFDFPQL